MSTDLSDTDPVQQLHALLGALAALGGPSSQDDRKKILRELGLTSRHSAILGRARAITPPEGMKSDETNLRDLTELGRSWLADESQILSNRFNPGQRARMHEALRRFA